MISKRFIKAIVRRDITYLNKKISRQGLYEFLKKHFDKIEPGARVLSIGSGGEVNRLLSKCANRIGFQVLTLDIDPDRKPDLVADLCEQGLSLGTESFDTVVCCEVLEHCYNPFIAMDNMHRFLDAEGQLILTTPFLFPIHEEPVDFFRYTEYGLRHLCRDFDDVAITTSNTFAEAWNTHLVRYRGFGKFGNWATTASAYCLLPIVWLLNHGEQGLGTTRYLLTAKKPPSP